MPTRREQLIAEAARMFAVRGYHGVSLDELGAACGISGPAVYKHFANKDAVLEAVLVGISESLLDGARKVLANATSPASALDDLLAAHTEFALSRPEFIRVHDRDLASLLPAGARKVRRLQRSYAEIWVDTLRELDAGLAPEEARARVQAGFGLMNSSPHLHGERSVHGALLQRMARAALLA